MTRFVYSSWFSVNFSVLQSVSLSLYRMKTCRARWRSYRIEFCPCLMTWGRARPSGSTLPGNWGSLRTRSRRRKTGLSLPLSLSSSLCFHWQSTKWPGRKTGKGENVSHKLSLLIDTKCSQCCVYTSSRIKDLLEANRKLEEKVTDLNSQMANCIQTNKLLIDEHQALQTLYNAHERKLRESQTENDQIVSSPSFLVP